MAQLVHRRCHPRSQIPIINSVPATVVSMFLGLLLKYVFSIDRQVGYLAPVLSLSMGSIELLVGGGLVCVLW